MINGITLINEKAYYVNGKLETSAPSDASNKKTIAYSILSSHNSGDEKSLKIRFDALASHDITYVGIIQTAKASGLKDTSLEGTVASATAALLATEFLGGIGNLAAVLGLGSALTLGGEIIEDVQIDHVVIGLYAEDLFVQDDFLSGFSSVDLVYRKFHSLSLQN